MFYNYSSFILFFIDSPTLRDSKMNELRPIVEESNLLDEERKLLEDRISQVSLLKKEQRNTLNASISFYQIFILKLCICLAVGCRDYRLQ